MKHWIQSLLIRLRHRAIRLAGRRVIYIDCGANVGQVLEKQIQKDPRREYFGFEPNPELLSALRAVARRHPGVALEINGQAVWTFDGTVDLFLSRENSQGECVADGSTLLRGKVPKQPGSGRIDYEHPVTVPCIDFSRWMLGKFKRRDFIYLKMDIEGAEYAVLERMLDDGSLAWVNYAYIEFHYSDDGRIGSLDRETHERVVTRVRQVTKLKKWS